jgi:hypothetical protein
MSTALLMKVEVEAGKGLAVLPTKDGSADPVYGTVTGTLREDGVDGPNLAMAILCLVKSLEEQFAHK